ncbi:MAG: TldD/PmbA family protein, partial [Victivallales bacterium]|nr:TldD/PmbA family protein [Victivallales bacterium]
FENNRLKGLGENEAEHYTISLIRNGRQGSVTGNIPEELPKLVQTALDISEHGAVSHFDRLPPFRPAPRLTKTYSASISRLTSRKMLKDCRELMDGLRAISPKLVCGAGAGVSVTEGLRLTTAGARRILHASLWSLSGDFQLTKGTDMLFGSGGRQGVRVDGLYSVPDILKSLEFTYRHGRKTVSLASGTYPVLLSPGMASQFLVPLLMGLSGRNVLKGTSPLKNKVGQQCFNPILNLLDDPHRDYNTQSCNYDEVDLPTERKYLVKDGVPTGFLYDYDTAAMAGVETTHNKDCAPYTCLLTPGEENHKETIKGMKRGIYLKELLGMGQSNLTNGDISANISLGYLVENGKIVGRIKDAMLSCNIFEALKGDIRPSSDQAPTSKQPWLLLPKISIKA